MGPMVSESLKSLSSLYITSCGIEGKSPETLRSYAETLKHFMRSVDHLGLPNDPVLFRPADVYEFLGHVGSTGVSAITQWRRQPDCSQQPPIRKGPCDFYWTQA